MTELALALDIDPLELRRRNVIQPGDALVAMGEHPEDVSFTEDGLTGCIDLVDEALRGRPDEPDLGPDWLVGTGTASSIHETAPPTDHVSEAWATLRDDGIYEIAVGTVEFGEGTSTAHVQIAASVLGTTPSRVHLVQSDTDKNGFRHRRVRQCGPVRIGQRRAEGLDRAARQHSAVRRRATSASMSRACSMDDDGVRCARCPVDAGRGAGGRPCARQAIHRVAQGLWFAAQRDIQCPRLPYRRAPGHRRDPHSVQRARRRSRSRDQPQQVRGQIEGGVAQAIGFALTENFRVDENGVMVNPNLRNYRIPTYADVPRTEVLLVETHDSVGPMKSKGIAESNVNPVAPALANALQDATGIRYRELPFTPSASTADSNRAQSRLRQPDWQDMDTTRGHRHHRDGHHRPERARRQRSGIRGVAEGNEPRGARSIPVSSPPRSIRRPRFNASGWSSFASTRSRMFRRGSTARHVRSDSTPVSSTSTGPAPSRSSAAVRGRAIPWSPSWSRTASTPENVDEFLAWQDRLRLAESKFQGFRGTELFRPVEGIQEEWTALYRYKTAEDLNRWLISDERKALLAEGEKFADYHLRTIDNSFGNWFAFDEHGTRRRRRRRLQDVHRRLGGPVSDRRDDHACAVTVEDAAVAGPADRKPAVQLRLELLDDAVLRQSAAEELAAAAPRGVRSHERTGGASPSSSASTFLGLVFYLVTRVFWHLP